MSESDTERTVVKTYVPAYQREQWDDHADDLDMNRSEFVKTMVQAGRRGFGREETESERDLDSKRDGGTGSGSDASLEAEVVGMLSEGPRDWDELLAELTAEVENDLDETLQELQETSRVRYSGRDGGYVLE